MKSKSTISFAIGILLSFIGFMLFVYTESAGSVMFLTIGLILIIGASLQKFIEDTKGVTENEN
ncbi:hypothetical protein LCGC14_2229280 [marine sediment metagenome]|uniref:Uncharacterized protein n=1 Tax=marine sediment metagenome TaxID=412755 RepID=A0A0F9G3Y2_9ZZZZ